MNILSVDFDWVMAPSIELYNHGVGSANSVDNLLKKNPGAHFNIDYKKYYELSLLLFETSKHIVIPDRIMISDNHNDIAYHINTTWNIQEDYALYNIDHHHDCGYGVDTIQQMRDQGLTCGNWVHWCNHLADYTWINNPTSNCTLSDELRQAVPNYKMCNDLNILKNKEFDYLFLCLSPGWVPEEYWLLYDLIAYIMKNCCSVPIILRSEDNNI